MTERQGELAGEDAELASRDHATPAQLEVTLDRLCQLQRRVEQRQLGRDDWALLGALIRETT